MTVRISAAVTTRCEQAAQAIEIDYEPMPAVLMRMVLGLVVNSLSAARKTSQHQE
jgi:hypothetical protein